MMMIMMMIHNNSMAASNRRPLNAKHSHRFYIKHCMFNYVKINSKNRLANGRVANISVNVLKPRAAALTRN